MTTLNAGAHFLNSISQFNITLVGTTTKCGPQCPRSTARYASIEIVIRVLPNPISSARIPFKRLSYSAIIHFNATDWYSRRDALMRNGVSIGFSPCPAVDKVHPDGCDSSADFDALASRAVLRFCSCFSSSVKSIELASSSIARSASSASRAVASAALTSSSATSIAVAPAPSAAAGISPAAAASLSTPWLSSTSLMGALASFSNAPTASVSAGFWPEPSSSSNVVSSSSASPG